MPSCATTSSPGLFGFQNNSEKFRADYRQGSKNAPVMRRRAYGSGEKALSPLRIDTELHVTTAEERAAMRGRSLNISEGGTAGYLPGE
jgi:hypothetical protein